jgi:(1->4)-alpha-D-glucan 1-alpha-D-glucosylmutase
VATLVPDPDVPPLGEGVWGDTTILLPSPAPASLRHILTGRCIAVTRAGDTASVRAADVFAHFPIALLAAD